jgi:hypothetical protein
MESIANYRKRYGKNWLSTFPDIDLQIPWRALTVQEFLDYDQMFRIGQYTDIEIEDEIFCLCVLEPVYVENIDRLQSGIVTSVVQHIMQLSGQIDPASLNNDLNYARAAVQDFMSSAVTLVCSVFPAYKPEDVFALPYETFMKRVAMAEKRLLELGVLQEPLTIYHAGQEQVKEAPKEQAEKPSDRKKRELIERRRAEMESKLADLNKESNNLTSTGGTIITKRQMSAPLETDTGHEMMDRVLWQSDAVAGLEHIYPEYFKMMKEGKKITPEVIKQVKGNSVAEIKEKHEEYIEKVISGEIKPVPSKMLVADKMEGQSVRKQPVRVKRR